MNKFLLEIGLEEMPAKMILPAVEQLMNLIKNTCENNFLSFKEIRTFSTPRRLAVMVLGLPDKQSDRRIELKGPPVEIAKDIENKWTKSAKGFAKKNGVEVNDLEIKKFEGKDYLFFQKFEAGHSLPELLQPHIGEWITQINFPKNMRWGSYKMRFIRPIRWIVSLWNNSIIPVKLEMVKAGNVTHGHRFLSSGEAIISEAADYENHLKKLFVIVDFEKRRESIVSQVKKLEKEKKIVVELDENLLSEVTNLVEWPTVILGDFGKEFLELPFEVLVTTMAVNQRYFPVFQKNKNQSFKSNKILPHFVTVRNGNKKNVGIVRRGNAKVLKARLSDARFFYKEDQNKTLEEFCQMAKNVVFFEQRGTQEQRVERIVDLSLFIGKKFGLSSEKIKKIRRIAKLSKFDLVTQMVQEFPELQGIMGEKYALLRSEDAVVCRGIKEHYYPRNAKDSLPKDSETVAVALADKLDLLITAFSLDLRPTGATDPFALRRAAQGIINLIFGLRISLNIQEVLVKSISTLYEQQAINFDRSKLENELMNFLIKRQRWYLQEQGIRYDLIDAVLQYKSEDNLKIQKYTSLALPMEQLKFAELLSEYLEKEIFKRSVEAVVRAENICKKYPQKIAKKIKEVDLLLPEEKSFYKILHPIISSDHKTLWTAENYVKQLLLIEPVVTVFFKNVLVIDDDPLKCGNRLFLCGTLANWSKRHINLKAIIFS